MLPPQKNEDKDEIFAKKIIEILEKEITVSDATANRLALARQKALTKLKTSEEVSVLTNEVFAKQVVGVLKENNSVNSDVEKQLTVSRQKALSYLRESKKEKNLLNKFVDLFKEKLNVQIMTGLTTAATVCFALVGVFAMDAENEIVYENNLVAIQAHFDNADDINKDVGEVLTTDDEEEEDNTI